MDELLTIKEASKKYHISERTLYKLISDGKIASVHIGGSVRIDPNSFGSSTNTPVDSASASRDEATSIGRAAQIIGNIVVELKDLRDKIEEQEEQFKSQGVINVLPPRRMSPSTVGNIQEAIRKASGDVFLQGVALRGFFMKDGFFFDSLYNKLKNKDISIKAIMLYPTGDAAKARAVAEGAIELTGASNESQSSEKVNSSFYKTDLFHNIRRSLWSAEELSQEFGERLQVKFMDMHPSVWMVQTQDIMFTEIYHLGRPEAEIPGKMIGGCVGEQVPILTLTPQSNLYILLSASFQHVWSASNPFIKMKSIVEVKQELEDIP
jgi:excisionase family DNA binding protein